MNIIMKTQFDKRKLGIFFKNEMLNTNYKGKNC